jgi:hypothetical protein
VERKVEIVTEFHIPERLETLPMTGGMEGAEIVCNVACPLRIWTKVYELARGVTEPGDALQKWPRIEAIFTRWGLRSWNLVDPDGPIRIDQFSDMDPGIRSQIVGAWVQLGMRVAAPLAVLSAAGKQSAEPSTPKARRSRRRPS